MLYCLLAVHVFAQNVDPKYINGKTFSEYGNVNMPETNCMSVSVYNPESGFCIYEKNPNTTVYPASTVKIMTAIVAYENIPDKSVPITVTRKVVNESTGLKLGLETGDKYTAEDLIRAVLICGSNDAANLLADYVSDGEKSRFIKLMNSKAESLGCKSTKFTNVTGLHDPNMQTTASDMMRIAIYAYSLGNLAEWSSSASYTFTPLDNPDNYKLRYNRNDFVSRSARSDYYYKNAFGLNSGYTPEAGNCLVTAATKNGLTYIVVAMNCPYKEKDNTNYAYIDAKKILNSCFDNFEIKTVTDTTSVVSEVSLKLSVNDDHIPLFPEKELKHILPVKLEANDIKFEKIIKNEIYKAPVKSGEVIGELIIKYKNDFILGKTNLICKNDYERSAVLFIIEKIKDFLTSTFFIVTSITAVILFVIYTVISIKHRHNHFRMH